MQNTNVKKWRLALEVDIPDMPLKLKITLGVMLLIAGFVITRIGLTFKGGFQSASLALNSVMTPTPEPNPLTIDTDKDGLSDRDEIIFGTDPFSKDTDGDGYLDGEEVATGHDPLDPNDRPNTHQESLAATGHLGQSSPNLTTRVLSLSMASLTGNDGVLDPNEMDSKKFAAIIQGVNNQAVMALGAKPLTDSDIKIVDDNSVEFIKKYLKSVTQVVEEGIFSAGSSAIYGTISGQVLELATDGLGYYESKYNSLMILEVPSSWKEIHKQVLVDLNKLSNSTKALGTQRIEDDPVKASFALSQLQESFLGLHDVLNQALSLAKSQKIPIEDSVLQSLQSAK